MKHFIVAGIAVIALAVAAAPASAVTKKHTQHHVTCKQIKDAIDGGKSSEDVQKDMHVTSARVKACTTTEKVKSKVAPENPS